MRRLIVLMALVAAVGGAAYLYKFKRKEVTDLLVPPARSPMEAVDRFRDAIKDRNFERAARYCTASYAEVLTKSHKAAKELGGMVDDLRHRLQNDGLMTAELRNVLDALDPFPTNLVMTVGSSSEIDAIVSITVPLPHGEEWQINSLPTMGLYAGLPGSIHAVRQGSSNGAEWKLDFPVPPTLQTAVTELNDKYKDVVNPLKVLTAEVKNEPTTKENVRSRMKTLLEEAARNPR